MQAKRPAEAPTDPVLTPRLVLTPVGPDDVNDLLLLYSDPVVAYWTGPWTRAAVEAWAADMAARWTADGVGKWVARDRSDGSLVGRGGFTRFDLDGETVLELGWAVRDARTGRGYATELGRAALAWAVAHQPDLLVAAFTEVHNRASRAVMERLGMRPAGIIRREGLVEGRTGVHPDAPFALYDSEVLATSSTRPAVRRVLGSRGPRSVRTPSLRLQGRPRPEWRLAFEHRVDTDARTRIRHAVNRGQSVTDRNEAAVAAGFARRDQRAARRHGFIFLPIQVVFPSVWLAWMLDQERRVPVAFLWFWTAVWIVLVGVAPFLIWRRIRIARRAAEAHDHVAHHADDLPA